MNFSNKKVLRTFASPHSKNGWGYIESIGWRKIGQNSTDGVTNMYNMLNEARANNMAVSGTINASDFITILYL